MTSIKKAIQRFPVTVVLVAVNVLYFTLIAIYQQSITMNTSADVLAILNAGANLNPFTLGGEPWRILTAMFLHFGIVHLAVNMYALWNLGSILEPGVGSVRFIIIYIICGFAASIASLFFNVYVISAGASGAIFGLYGYQLGAEFIGSFHDREKLKVVLLNFFIFVVVNVFIAGQVNVDLSGHIGGGIAGFVLALCHFKVGVLKEKTALAAVMVLLPFSLFLVPRHQLNYYRIFSRVVKQEVHINKLYREVKNEQALADSLKSVRKEWKAIDSSLYALKHIPVEVAQDTAVLHRYITLRKREADFRISLMERESYIYLDSLELLPAQFDSLPKLRYVLNYQLPATREVEEDTTTLQAQPAVETARVFYDKDWKEISNPIEAVYYRIGTKDSLGRWQGSVRDFYRDGTIQMKGKYTNNLRDGVFIYYSNRGTYTSAGRYEKERAVGKWENFHWNGALQSEIIYGTESFTKNVWDSLGNAQVVNGEGKYQRWHANGTLAEEGQYEGGKREGYWHGFHENGKPYFKELYRDNRLIQGASESLDGKRYVYDQLSEFPFPVIGLEKYKVYLEKNRRMPDGVNTPQGVVKVLFNVGVDGTLWDFVIMESISTACDNEALRLIKEGPSWRPALLHGDKKIQSQGYMEVLF